MGLPGSGKTTLAGEVQKNTGGVWFNADDVRNNITYHLGFSEEDRIQQALTMRWLADKVAEAKHLAIVDFICPTPATRNAFIDDNTYVIWVDRIQTGRFEDTNQMFVPPEQYDVRVIDDGRSAKEWAVEITAPLFDW